MTIENANNAISTAKYHGDLTGIEQALLALLMDLQVRYFELLGRVEKLEKLGPK